MSKHNSTYKGWDVITIDNKWLTVHVAPKLGGRIIQVGLPGEELLFNNANLNGIDIETASSNDKTKWLNFGGEKIWPAPQGWDSQEQWPGPPDVILDGGFYTVCDDILTDETSHSVRLLSEQDPYTGLQIIKDITISEKTSAIHVKATFINRSDSVKKWSIWPVIQLDTPDVSSKDRYGIVCPINADSKFEEGFYVMHGLANCPQYAVDGFNNFQVTNKYLVGKVGLDTDANWVAFCDKKNGNVLVATFEYDSHAVYPDGTSVQIWVQGEGLTYSRNRINRYADNPSENFPYMEIELLSPLCEMPSGNQMSFEYEIILCKIPENTSVLKKNDIGVIASSMAITSHDNYIEVKGKYGVFSEGLLKLYFTNEDQEILTTNPIVEWSVSPTQGIMLDIEIYDFPVDEDGKIGLTFKFFDLEGTYVGDLDQNSILTRYNNYQNL
ncbi:MAG: DUF4380 domain-containing protein [Pedobacter sp.]|nr:MAG: DUF4380 domain-containing protein [Pedobacter sp.]